MTLFEPSDPSLLVSEARTARTKARILIDDSAELSHISKDFCDKYSIVLNGENYTAYTAHSPPQKMGSTISPVTISLGDYAEKMRLAASLLNYELILGKTWTSAHKAIINCYTNEISFSHKGKMYNIVAKDPTNHSLIYVNSLTKDHHRKYPLFAVVLPKIGTGGTSQSGATNNLEKDIQRLKDEFKDIFPQQLLKGLPRNEPMTSALTSMKELLLRRKGFTECPQQNSQN